MKTNSWDKRVLSRTTYVLLALMIMARVISAYTWRFDSDEPQHLHVIWGWANGLLQYRDLFDNHAPLFHILFAPVYRLFGERPDILVVMRLAAIPLFLAALWAIYLIGRALYSRQVGLWAAVFAGLYPKFFLTSLEFRADDLWIVPWLLAIAVLVQKPVNTRRLLLAGILLGATLSTSLKTSMLLLALALAATVLVFFQRPAERLSASRYAANALRLLAGMSVIPLALIAYFYAGHGLSAMYYDVVQHNIVPGLGHWKHFGNALRALIALPLVLWAALYLQRQPDVPSRQRNARTLVFLIFGLAVITLYGFWPLVTRQDYLPLIPLMAIIVVGQAMERLSATLGQGERRYRYALVLAVVAVSEFGWLAMKERAAHENQVQDYQLLAATLQLTRPSDELMDLKGETVFRRRPFFYVLEGVTRKRMQLGTIRDSIPEDIVRTKTTVAAADSAFFPPRGRQFINENFISVGPLRVAGQMLEQQQGDIAFNIQIPASYAVVAEHGDVSGWLDGTPYTGPRLLASGIHHFRLNATPNDRLAVIWAPAIERGFSPFTLRRIS